MCYVSSGDYAMSVNLSVYVFVICILSLPIYYLLWDAEALGYLSYLFSFYLPAY